MTEIEKFENCKKERELINSFLDFALEKHDHLLCAEDETFDRGFLINDFFGIDDTKLEAEKNGHTTSD